MTDTDQSARTRPAAIKRMEHIGIVVDDVPAAVEFFIALGLELEGEARLENSLTVDRVNGLTGVRADIAMLRTPDGHGCIELCRYLEPKVHPGDQLAPPNTLGIRHFSFLVEGLDELVERMRGHGAELVGDVAQYEDSYRLVYLRGPGGAIIELAEQLG